LRFTSPPNRCTKVTAPVRGTETTNGTLAIGDQSAAIGHASVFAITSIALMCP
jgi:hypothetical protein